jgi:hypothetical protein
MRSILLKICLLLLISACSEKPRQENKNTQTDIPLAGGKASNYTIEIIAGQAGSFGYDIKRDGKLLIHQPHIPGIAGVRGFESEQQAQAAAKLMVSKMERNIMPPTISEHEIDSIVHL